MRALMLGAAVLFGSTSFAFADDIMVGYYGNTIIATMASSELHIHYRADHTFDGKGTAASGPIALKGVWSLDAKGQLCRNYDPPPPGTKNPACTPWSAHKVGDTWELPRMPGVQLKLVEGVR